MTPTILILSGKGQYVECFYNGINDIYPIMHVVIEDAPDEQQVLQRRRKRLGWLHVAGQQLFSKYTVAHLKKKSKSRVKEIILQHGLSFKKIPETQITYVPSVNHAGTISLIRKWDPDIIIVNSTRIISKKVLQAVRGYILNIHGGITPGYRGWAGAYWALANKEPHRCGSTIHFVDEGVDTGAVLCQATITVTPQDNYLTYPFLQLPNEIAMLRQVIADLAANQVKPLAVEGTSKEWYEPTIWAYWYNVLFKSVK